MKLFCLFMPLLFLVGIHALPESQHSRMLQDQVETIGEVPLIGTEVLVSTEEATVEGLVQTKGVGWTENVVVKLFRRVDGKKERMGTTRTASDGSYKFIVKGNETEGDFYIQVLKPEGYEFTRSKRCTSNVKTKNGKSGYFQVNLEEPIIRNACLQKEPETPGTLTEEPETPGTLTEEPETPGTLTEEPETTGTLTGVLFVDVNGNGVQDPDEPGLPSVDVSITDSSGYSQTITTDEKGEYQTIAAVGPAVIDIDPSTLPPIGCSDDMAMIEVNPTTVNVVGGDGGGVRRALQQVYGVRVIMYLVCVFSWRRPWIRCTLKTIITYFVAKKPNGSVCLVDKECESGECAAPGICGKQCSSDSNCDGNEWCNPAYSPDICRPKRANGFFPCIKDSQCYSGRCVDLTRVCKAKKSKGSLCLADKECLSDKCKWGKCK